MSRPGKTRGDKKYLWGYKKLFGGKTTKSWMKSEALKALMHYMRFFGADELKLIERAREASKGKRVLY